MRFFQAKKRDPVSAALVAAAVFVTFFIGFELLQGLHRYHGYMTMPLEKKGVAGVLGSSLSSGTLEISGWAPPQAAVQVMDHDKVMGNAVATADGNWNADFAFRRRDRNMRVFDLTYGSKGKTANLGRLGVFVPGRSEDEAYIWWDGPVQDHLLQAPAQAEDDNLFLALAWSHADKSLTFAGFAVPGDEVQIYAGNSYIGTAPVQGDGSWMLTSSLEAKPKGEYRLDELHKSEVVERRVYRINGSESRDGWSVEWPAGDSSNESVLVLKPDAGKEAPPDEQKPGQIIPLAQPL